MSVAVESGGFANREEAVDLIARMGLYPRDGTMAAGDLEDVHWHRTSLRIYVLSGRFETKDAATDRLLTAGAGDVIHIPSGTLHAARCPEPAIYVVGFESEAAARSFRPEPPEALGACDR